MGVKNQLNVNKVLFSIFLVLLLSSTVLAVNDPGHDSLYLQLIGGTLSGALTVNSYLNVTGNVYVGGNISMSGTKITNLANGTDGQDAVTLSQLQALNGTITGDFVPYTGADQNVDLGGYNLTTTGTISIGSNNVQQQVVGSCTYGIASVAENGTITCATQQGTGDVVGPSSATDNAIARFDKATGKLIQSSALRISDTTGAISFAEGDIMVGSSSTVFNHPEADSIVIGNLAYAGADAISLGTSTYTSAKAIAIGYDSNSSGISSIAIGEYSIASGNQAIAIGGTSTSSINTEATGVQSIAIGYNLTTSADNSILIGTSATTESTGSIVIGTSASVNNKAANSIALGTNTSVIASNAIAIGTGTTNAVENSFKVGGDITHTFLDTTLEVGGAIDMNSNKITELANGTSSQDAVTYSQLQAINTSILGGDVVGPSLATDNAIATFDGATGKIIQNSSFEISSNTIWSEDTNNVLAMWRGEGWNAYSNAGVEIMSYDSNPLLNFYSTSGDFYIGIDYDVDGGENFEISHDLFSSNDFVIDKDTGDISIGQTLNMTSGKITDLANGTDSQDAVTKSQLDAVSGSIETDTHVAGDGIYLTNDSTTMFFNESKLNETIETIGDTNYVPYTGATGTVNLGTNYLITGSVHPSSDNTYDLGLKDLFFGGVADRYWKDAYFKGTIYSENLDLNDKLIFSGTNGVIEIGSSSTTASGLSSIAIGPGASSTTEAIAIGLNANASGLLSIALGENAVSSGYSSVAIGHDATNNEDYTFMVGGSINKTFLDGILNVSGTIYGDDWAIIDKGLTVGDSSSPDSMNLYSPGTGWINGPQIELYSENHDSSIEFWGQGSADYSIGVDETSELFKLTTNYQMTDVDGLNFDMNSNFGFGIAPTSSKLTINGKVNITDNLILQGAIYNSTTIFIPQTVESNFEITNYGSYKGIILNVNDGLNQKDVLILNNTGAYFDNVKLINLANGTDGQDAVTKSQLDAVSGSIETDTDTWWNITGSNYLINSSNILELNETTLNATIDSRAVDIDGDTMSGDLNMSDNSITNINQLRFNLNEIQIGIDSVANSLDETGSIAIGKNSNAHESSISIGDNSKTQDDQSLAIGLNSNAVETYTIAIGSGANSVLEQSMAIGYDSNASGLGSTAIGTNSVSSGTVSSAIGSAAVSSGIASSSLGSGASTSGDFSVAIGPLSNATAENAIALGYGTENSVANSFKVGSQYVTHTFLDTTLNISGNTNISGNLSMETNKITNLANGTDGQDAVTKSQLDAINSSFSGDLSGYVPYTDATSNVNLGSYNLTTTGNIKTKTLNLDNDNWISAKNSAGTSTINMFKVNSDNQIEVGAPLNIGSFEFTADSGLVTFVDMPVTSSASIGTAEAYVFKIDRENILTIYSESDGSGGIQNKRVGVGTTTPTHELHVVGDANITGSIYSNGVLLTPDTDTFWNITTSQYLENRSGILDVNETELNATIDSRVSTNVPDIWVNESGDTMTGNLSMGGNYIQNLANGTLSQDAVTYSQLQAVNSTLGGDLANYVPYTDATNNLDLNNKNLTSVSYVGVGTATPNANLQVNGTFNATNNGGSITLDSNGDVRIGI